MKRLSAALQQHLDSGTTTLAWCWKLTRRDHVILAFTDHDRDIVVDGVTFEAATGFTASEVRDGVGLQVDNLEVEAALSSNRLDENHLAAGLYDDAAVEIWRVNWADPSQRVLMRKGSIGEVRRSGAQFTAEVRGLAHYLNQPKGRLYQFACDAMLGDARCSIQLSDPAFRADATIASVKSAREFTVSGADAFASSFFTRGIAALSSGPNAGMRVEIRGHRRASAVIIELWQDLPHLPSPGDALVLTAGCDKTFATCRDRFANAINFRGFPHIPGTDFVTTVARAGDPANDGAALR